MGKLQVIPRIAMLQLVKDDIAEELEDGTCGLKASVDTTAAVQSMFSAMGPSWIRDELIKNRDPEHL